MRFRLGKPQLISTNVPWLVDLHALAKSHPVSYVQVSMHLIYRLPQILIVPAQLGEMVKCCESRCISDGRRSPRRRWSSYNAVLFLKAVQ